MDHIWGIDYGAKKSGNTAVALTAGDQILLFQAEKGVDADRWLDGMLQKYPPVLVAIDAPLSLPKGWCGGEGDLFYRKCDCELKAMSPLFLGGLTARAVHFKRKLEEKSIAVIECYPKGFVCQLLDGNYPESEKSMDTILNQLPKSPRFKLASQPANEHQIDALISLVISIRHYNKQSISFGKSEEGLIWI